MPHSKALQKTALDHLHIRSETSCTTGGNHRGHFRLAAVAVSNPDLDWFWLAIGAEHIDGLLTAPADADLPRARRPTTSRGDDHAGEDRKSVVEGKRVSVRVDIGGRRIIKKKTSLRIHIRIRQ